MEYIFLPLGIFLMIVCPRRVLYGMFYNKYTQQWEGKKWQYYTAYAILQAVWFFLCTLPFMANVYIQIGNYFQLAIGQKEYVSLHDEHVKLSQDLPDTEFILVYEVRRNTPPEKLMHEIFPEIIEEQGSFSDWNIWDNNDYRDNHDYRIDKYYFKYNSANNTYLLCVDQGVAAEIEIKNTMFFKKIYYHGYWEVYQKYQKSQK